MLMLWPIKQLLLKKSPMPRCLESSVSYLGQFSWGKDEEVLQSGDYKRHRHIKSWIILPQSSTTGIIALIINRMLSGLPRSNVCLYNFLGHARKPYLQHVFVFLFNLTILSFDAVSFSRNSKRCPTPQNILSSLFGAVLAFDDWCAFLLSQH